MQTAQHVRLGGRAELAARPTPAFSRQRPLVAPRVGRTAVLAPAKRAEDGSKIVLLPGVSLSQWGWGCNRGRCLPSRSVSWVRVAVQTRDHSFRGAFCGTMHSGSCPVGRRVNSDVKHSTDMPACRIAPRPCMQACLHRIPRGSKSDSCRLAAWQPVTWQAWDGRNLGLQQL